MPPPIGSNSSQYSKVNLENLILKDQIRMTGVSEVNDPFDCNPHIVDDLTPRLVSRKVGELLRNPKTGPEMRHARSSIMKEYPNRKVRRAKISEIEERFRPLMRLGSMKFFQEFGFYSLTANSRSQLMWAHYAANHTGICLGFSTRGNKPAFGTAEEVIYQESRPRIQLSNSVALENKNKNHNEVGDALITKGKDWAYEKEWRFLSQHDDCLSKCGDVLSLQDSKLKVIILGIKANSATRSFVDKQLQLSGKKRVRILKASPSTDKFKIRYHS